MKESVINICNQALARMGGNQIKYIASLSDNTEESRACDLFYPQVRDSLLRAYPFSFSRKIASLALINIYENQRLAFEYGYPSDALYVWDIRPDNMPYFRFKPLHEFFVMLNSNNQKVIRCNLEQAYAYYSVSQLDSTLFEPLFTEALAMGLAQKLCVALANDENRAQVLAEQATIAVDRAISADANEQYREQPLSDYILVRY